mmetsp:Transcript_39713/g.100916  ORF Transcript_39713/g.100916 Transcript_39713/m.100916 type:complete len:228 (+) Transcript_39713:605-1288(+)
MAPVPGTRSRCMAIEPPSSTSRPQPWITGGRPLEAAAGAVAGWQQRPAAGQSLPAGPRSMRPRLPRSPKTAASAATRWASAVAAHGRWQHPVRRLSFAARSASQWAGMPTRERALLQRAVLTRCCVRCRRTTKGARRRDASSLPRLVCCRKICASSGTSSRTRGSLRMLLFSLTSRASRAPTSLCVRRGRSPRPRREIPKTSGRSARCLQLARRGLAAAILKITTAT